MSGQEVVELSPRMEQILELVGGRGMTYGEAADELGISEHTVNHYLKNAMAKLGTTNRIIAIVKALRLGLIDP